MADNPQPQAHPIYQQKYIKKEHSDWVRSVAFSPDGQHLASAADDKTIKLWEAGSGVLLKTLKGHSNYVRCVTFSPKGQHLASASNDQTIRSWDQSSGANTATLAGHSNQIRSVAYSPDGTLLASASDDYTCRLWNTTSNTQIAKFDTGDDRLFSVTFSPDGRYVASGSISSIFVWEVASEEKVKTLEGHGGTVNSMVFSPDGSLLCSGSNDATVRLWNLASGKTIATLSGHQDYVESVAFSPNGAIIASSTWGGSIHLWDVASFSPITILANDLGRVYSVAFSPDGSLLAAGLKDGTIRLWERADHTVTETPPIQSLPDITTLTLQDTQDMSGTGPSSAEYTPVTDIGSDISHLVTLADSERISSGGFGDLFLGTHKELGKVAMKRPHVLLNEVSTRRFLREVGLWRNMSHQYILQCLGTCKIGREVYMVSPFVENGDLMSCIQRGVVLNRSKLLYEVAEALSHLHHRGIVHGDVKAQNVLLSNDGSALLCDFGLAKAFDTMATSTEAKGSGSLRWMAPELLTGESGRCMATDVYSLGMTIAEVLSGGPPFGNILENMAVMFHVVLKHGRPEKEPSSSPDGKSYSVLWETAEKCWVTEAKDRPFMAQVLGMLFPLTREK